MKIYQKEGIFALFAQAGAVPKFPDGVTQEQLCDLYVEDPRSSYGQYLYDAICKAQADPLCRETQSEYPLSFTSIREAMLRWDRDRELGNGAYPIDFEQALGGYRQRQELHSQWLKLNSSRPDATVTPSVERSKPLAEKRAAELTPEELQARRTATLERVRRHRERQRQSRLERAEERHDAIAAEEQARHKAFGAEFAGNPNPDPLKPAPSESSEDVPQSVPSSPWQ